MARLLVPRHLLSATVLMRFRVRLRAAVRSQPQHTKPQLRSTTRNTNGTNAVRRNNGMAEHQRTGTP